MAEEIDVNIFVTLDTSLPSDEARYFAEIYQLNDEGDPVGKALYKTGNYHSLGEAVAEAEFAWQESGGGGG